MKRNKKGFTLIELLAVIVILAIIALIAVPVILNILTKSRKSAAEDTAYSVLNAAELYYAEMLLDAPTEAFAETTFTFSANGDTITKTVGGVTVTDGPTIEVKGTKPTAGAVKVVADGEATISESLKINNFTCTQSGTSVDCN